MRPLVEIWKRPDYNRDDKYDGSVQDGGEKNHQSGAVGGSVIGSGMGGEWCSFGEVEEEEYESVSIVSPIARASSLVCARAGRKILTSQQSKPTVHRSEQSQALPQHSHSRSTLCSILCRADSPR